MKQQPESVTEVRDEQLFTPDLVNSGVHDKVPSVTRGLSDLHEILKERNKTIVTWQGHLLPPLSAKQTFSSELQSASWLERWRVCLRNSLAALLTFSFGPPRWKKVLSRPLSCPLGPLPSANQRRRKESGAPESSAWGALDTAGTLQRLASVDLCDWQSHVFLMWWN